MSKGRNKGAQRFQLESLMFLGKKMQIAGGEVIFRRDGTVAICPVGRMNMDFKNYPEWVMQDRGQNLFPGAVVALLCGSATAEVTLGEQQ